MRARTFRFRRAFPGLESASDAQLAAFVVAGQGASIRWPELRVATGTPALVRWITGQRDETTLRQLANIARMRAQPLAAERETVLA